MNATAQPTQQQTAAQPIVPARSPATTQTRPAVPNGSPPLRRIVMAGMKALYSQQVSAGIVEILKTGADNPAQALAEATTRLLLALNEKASGKIPRPLLMPAAQALLRVVADFAMRLQIFQVDAAVAKQATMLLARMMLKAFGGGGPQPPGGAAQQSPQQEPPMGGGMVGRAMHVQQQQAA